MNQDEIIKLTAEARKSGPLHLGYQLSMVIIGFIGLEVLAIGFGFHIVLLLCAIGGAGSLSYQDELRRKTKILDEAIALLNSSIK